jgi:hypothetical protein
VFTDHVVVVFIDRATSHDADLLVLAHDEPVEVQARFSLLLQRSFGDELLKIFNGFSINGVAVKIGSGRQIDLGPRHVQKAEWLTLREGTRFFSVHDVVRDTGYSLGALGRRTQSAKGTNYRHKSSFIR